MLGWYYNSCTCNSYVCVGAIMKEPFTVTEIIKVDYVKFAFSSFREIADNLRGALKNGMLKRGKRYEIIIKEI